jgi:hypothetical protein
VAVQRRFFIVILFFFKSIFHRRSPDRVPRGCAPWIHVHSGPQGRATLPDCGWTAQQTSVHNPPFGSGLAVQEQRRRFLCRFDLVFDQKLHKLIKVSP